MRLLSGDQNGSVQSNLESVAGWAPDDARLFVNTCWIPSTMDA